MGKAKKPGHGRPVQPLGSSLGLINPFKAIEDHRSTHDVPARAQLNHYPSNEPANDGQFRHSVTDAPRSLLRPVDDTWNSFHSGGALGDLAQNYNAASYNPPLNDNKESFVHKKLSKYVVEQPTTPTAIQDNAFHNQFETIHKNTTGSSLYKTMTIAEFLDRDQGDHLVYDRTKHQVDSCLTPNSSVNNPGCSPCNCLFEPSADVLDFLDLRRNFNAWLQISRLRNENRHPTLKQYVAAVLGEFEDGYKDLEDKLAEKLFPTSGVRYQKAKG
ncbi:hypothetical protein MMC18_005370 [Xylographa bjoerkii]|nr:hypothetical protein [Xylographa bjoerkii]